MFEKIRIRWAITAAAVDAGLSKQQQDEINRTFNGWPGLTEVRAGLRQGVLRDVNEAAAYSCASLASYFIVENQKLPEGNAVARRLNERPRETLQFRTPAERFAQCVALTD